MIGWIMSIIDAAREDIRGTAILSSLLAFWGDILLYSGDVIVDVALLIVSTVDLWVPLLGNLAKLSDVFGWIPADSLETVLMAGIAILTVTYAIQLADRAVNKLRD